MGPLAIENQCNEAANVVAGMVEIAYQFCTNRLFYFVGKSVYATFSIPIITPGTE